MGKATDYNNLWIEKYRPKTLDALVLEESTRLDIEKYVKAGDIPHLLLYGQAGGGKTSLAKVIVQDLLDCDYMYINASDQSGVDTVRGDITSFAERKSMDGKIKVIILDECDGLSSKSGAGSSAQQALRNLMEEYAHNVRFILTANYFNKIIDPIISRCISYQINPPLKDFGMRCYNILLEESVEVESTGFGDYIKQYYPDMRKAINSMQRDTVDGKLVIPTTDTEDSPILGDILNHIRQNKSHVALRTMIIRRTVEFNNDYRVLLTDLFNYVYRSDLDIKDKRIWLMELSSGLYKHELVMDKEINTYNTLLKVYT